MGGGSSLWSLDHGDYFQFTFEWTTTGVMYAYVHEVHLSDSSTIELGQNIYYAGLSFINAIVADWYRVSLTMTHKSGYQYTTQNGPLVMGIEIEDM